eukprot:jgi/Chlat1/8530/Chrsp82S07969
MISCRQMCTSALEEAGCTMAGRYGVCLPEEKREAAAWRACYCACIQGHHHRSRRLTAGFATNVSVNFDTSDLTTTGLG